MSHEQYMQRLDRCDDEENPYCPHHLAKGALVEELLSGDGPIHVSFWQGESTWPLEAQD